MQDVHKIGLTDFDNPLSKMLLWHSSNTLYSMVATNHHRIAMRVAFLLDFQGGDLN